MNNNNETTTAETVIAPSTGHSSWLNHINRPLSLVIFYERKTLGFKAVDVTPFNPNRNINLPFDKLFNLLSTDDVELNRANMEIGMFAIKTLGGIETIRMNSGKSDFFIEYGAAIPVEFLKSLARIETLTVTFSGWPAKELQRHNDVYQRSVAFFRKKTAEFHQARAAARQLAKQNTEKTITTPDAKVSEEVVVEKAVEVVAKKEAKTPAKTAKKPVSKPKPASEQAIVALANKHPHPANKKDKKASA